MMALMLAATSMLLVISPAQAVAPGSPTIDSITAGNVTLSVNFTVGGAGDSAITSYEYSTNGGTTWKARETGTTESPLVITTVSTAATALVNGTAYTVAIRAVNSSGSGSASTTVAAVPSTVPTAPTVGVVTASSTQLSWAFTPLATTVAMGGLTVTNYEYSLDGGSTWTVRSPLAVTSPLVITGLTNGTAYSLALRAVNPNGSGATSALASGTPKGVPATPSIVSITPSSQTLTVTFTAASDGGSTITNYQYTTNAGTNWKNRATGTTASPIVITTVSSGAGALANGTAYVVGIRAVNAIGNSASSNFVSGTPATVPGAPTAVTAVAGNGSAAVSWTAPASTGGAAITSYTVTSTAGGFTCTATTTPCTVTGLTAGGGYSFTVTATNIVGTSAASTASTSVVPTAAAPSAPTGVSGIVGNGQVTVSWSVPSSNGGATITSYTATASPSGATCSTSGTFCVFTGLSNGTAYSFTVTATNSAGTSVASAASGGLVPTTGVVAPGTPSITSVVAGDGSAVVNVNPGSGGAPTLYTVTSSPGGLTCSTTGTSCTVTGLSNGTAYSFTATASNSVGTSGRSSASTSVTPSASVAPPTPAPTTVTAPSSGTIEAPPVAESKVLVASPSLSKATEKTLDALAAKAKKCRCKIAITVTDTRTAAAKKADPRLPSKIATSLSKYLKSKDPKASVSTKVVNVKPTSGAGIKGLPVTVTLRKP
ncbi:MAG: fibronectin type III domain-containing protein [Candidatus Nanopelagicales bacterium]